MISINLHRCTKIRATDHDTETANWTDYLFLDKDGNPLLELTVFDKPEIEKESDNG